MGPSGPSSSGPSGPFVPVDDNYGPSVEANVEEPISFEGDMEDHDKPGMDTTEDTTPLDAFANPNVFIPRKNMQLPPYEVTRATQVPIAPPKTPYSAQESSLYAYLMDTPKEQAKYKKEGKQSISWDLFAKRWEYWCKVETACGKHGYQLRTNAQLKQKKKDNASSRRN